MVTDRQLELSSHVSAVNASARIKSCSYGQVPLQEVLDVGAPRTDIQGVSHEVGTAFSPASDFQEDVCSGISGCEVLEPHGLISSEDSL